MSEQRFEPTAAGYDVGVEERDEVRLADGQPRVASGGRAPAGGMAQDTHVTVQTCEVTHLHGLRRPVVDHHDAHPAQRFDQSPKPSGIVQHGNHHGDVPV